MAFQYIRNVNGKIVSAKCNLDQFKSIRITPFLGVTYLHIADSRKNKSVSINFSDFKNIIQMNDVVEEIHRELHEVSPMILYKFFSD